MAVVTIGFTSFNFGIQTPYLSQRGTQLSQIATKTQQWVMPIPVLTMRGLLPSSACPSGCLKEPWTRTVSGKSFTNARISPQSGQIAVPVLNHSSIKRFVYIYSSDLFIAHVSRSNMRYILLSVGPLVLTFLRRTPPCSMPLSSRSRPGRPLRWILNSG